MLRKRSLVPMNNRQKLNARDVLLVNFTPTGAARRNMLFSTYCMTTPRERQRLDFTRITSLFPFHADVYYQY